MAAKTNRTNAPAAVSHEADGKSDYIVNDKAPMKVAGRRVKAGDHLRLSEDEARGELLALHIRPAEQDPAEA